VDPQGAELSRGLRAPNAAALLIAARRNRPSARARLIESFMPLIARVARMYRHVPGVGHTELVQEGVVGLLRALERYDPELRTPFWAYASWWVREAMQQLVSELSRPMVLSDRALRQLARVRAARRSFACAHGHEPSSLELAEASGVPVAQLQSLVAAERCARTLEQDVTNRHGGDGALVSDLVADPRAEDAYDELATRLAAADVPNLLDRLNERQRSVIEARYGLVGREWSLRELGETMGVSAERVRQIEEAALRAMRAACDGNPPDCSSARTRPTRARRVDTPRKPYPSARRRSSYIASR